MKWYRLDVSVPTHDSTTEEEAQARVERALNRAFHFGPHVIVHEIREETEKD